ncbi:MAG: helix-turn-helix transcriptional regulator [Tepidiformaceae bacterium]
MVMRPAHYNTRYKHDLTPRQREVLELIARGRTNAEIGERLGLSLDGAKWHVGEILSKLNLDSREQAADYWRNYQRPLARLARTFAAISMPGAFKVGLAGGAALGIVGIAVAAVIALRGGGDERGTLGVTPDKACVVTDIAPSTASVDVAGTTRIVVQAAAPSPCRFHGEVALSLSGANDEPVPANGNPSPFVTFDAALGATPTDIVAASWTNWCGAQNGFVLNVTFRGPGAHLFAFDLPIPTCENPSRPSVFNAVYAPLSPFASPTPTVVPTDSPGRDAARAFAEALAVRIVTGDIPALLAGAKGHSYVCGSPDQIDAQSALCARHPAGQAIEVFHIALHGSEGELHERQGFEASALRWLPRALSLASIGCAVDNDPCDKFIVAFRSDLSVVYFVFETPPGESSPRLSGLGLSGDNADTILNGGVTGTDLGQTLFIPVR